MEYNGLFYRVQRHCSRQTWSETWGICKQVNCVALLCVCIICQQLYKLFPLFSYEDLQAAMKNSNRPFLIGVKHGMYNFS